METIEENHFKKIPQSYCWSTSMRHLTLVYRYIPGGGHVTSHELRERLTSDQGMGAVPVVVRLD